MREMQIEESENEEMEFSGRRGSQVLQGTEASDSIPKTMNTNQSLSSSQNESDESMKSDDEDPAQS